MIAKLDAFASRVSDRVNPIVMKELRQSMRNWAVIVVILLMLGIQVFAMGMFMLKDAERTHVSQTMGSDLFAVLNGILFGLSCFFIPLYAGARFSAERNNMDLMFITTLRPSSIVVGKWLSAVVIAAMMYSASLPFMTLTYLLKGIDVPTIITVMTMNFVLVLCASAFAVLMTSLGAGLGLGLLTGLLSLGAIAAALSIGFLFNSEIGRRGISYLISGGQYWTTLGVYLGLAAYLIGFCLIMGTAAISAPASNRMLPVRIYLTSGMVVSGVVVSLLAWHYRETAPIYIWAMVHVGLACLSMFFAVSERDSWGARITRKIPKNKLGQLLAFLFFTGSPGGLVWCVVTAAMAIIGCCTLIPTLSLKTHELDDFALRSSGFVLYVLAFAASALILQRYVLSKIVPMAVTWLLAVLILAASYLTPVLYYFVQDETRRITRSSSLLSTITPIGLFGDDAMAVSSTICAAFWASIACAIILPWFVRSVRKFRHVHHVSQNLPMSAEQLSADALQGMAVDRASAGELQTQSQAEESPKNSGEMKLDG